MNCPEVSSIDLYLADYNNFVYKGDVFPLEVESSYIWSSDRDGEQDCQLFYEWVVISAVEDEGIIAVIPMASVTVPYEELVAVLEQNNQN